MFDMILDMDFVRLEYMTTQVASNISVKPRNIRRLNAIIETTNDYINYVYVWIK